MQFTKFAFAAALCAMFVVQTEARTLYVDASRPNNKGNGLKLKTAKKTIQAAINIAKKGDTILVYPGTYAPIKTKNKKITIKGVKGKSKTTILKKSKSSEAIALLGKTETYIGTAAPMDSRMVKRSTEPYSEGNESALVGFTLDGGARGANGDIIGVSGGTLKSSTITRICDESGDTYRTASAAFGANLTSCLISGNSFLGTFPIDYCTLKLCTIRGNTGDKGSGVAGGSTLVNTLVANNTIGDWAFYSSKLINCTIADNDSFYVYSALEFSYKSKFYNCILFNNRRAKATLTDDGYVLGKSSIHNVDKGNTYKNTDKTNKNPKFTSAYKLRKGSYAINKGKLTESQKKLVGTKDLAGKKRIKGKAIDCGCYEY